MLHSVLGATFGAFIVGYITKQFVPECLGGGTIATKISLAISSPIPLRIGICRLLLSSVYVGLGNPLGIEAPTIHLSAAVASALHNFAITCVPGMDARGRYGWDFKLPLVMVLGCCGGLSYELDFLTPAMLYCQKTLPLAPLLSLSPGAVCVCRCACASCLRPLSFDMSIPSSSTRRKV